MNYQKTQITDDRRALLDALGRARQTVARVQGSVDMTAGQYFDCVQLAEEIQFALNLVRSGVLEHPCILRE